MAAGAASPPPFELAAELLGHEGAVSRRCVDVMMCVGGGC